MDEIDLYEWVRVPHTAPDKFSFGVTDAWLVYDTAVGSGSGWYKMKRWNGITARYEFKDFHISDVRRMRE